MLTLDRVSKTYRGAQAPVSALRDVTLRVRPGEFVAVTGPAGCGKSALLLASGALLAPDSGLVALGGTNPYALSPYLRAVFRGVGIGLIFQQPRLIPYLSVLDNVRVAILEKDPVSPPRHPDELLERFGLAHRAAALPSELAHAQRQRVALARALVNDPPLLLADEPTGDLDEDSAKAILDALADLAQHGRAVLMVTRDPRAATRASRMLRMSGGAIEESVTSPSPS